MTKKKVGIVGIYEPIRNNCKYQLDETLGEYLDIDVVDMKVVNLDKYDLIVGLDYAEHYFLQELPRKYSNKFILIKTAFDNEIINKLELIKHKNKVILISKEWGYTLECIQMINCIYQNNIEFIPYYSDIYNNKINGVDTALYVGNCHYKPKFINDYIDLGWRKITYDTYIQIIEFLNIKLENVSKKLNIIKNRFTNINNDNINAISTQIKLKYNVQGLINAMSMGVIIINVQGIIENYNNAINEYFNIASHNIIGKYITDIEILNSIYDLTSFGNNKAIEYYEPNSKNNYLIRSKSINISGVNSLKSIFIEKINKLSNEKPNNINSSKYTFDDIIGKSKKSNDVKSYAHKYSQIDSSILIIGPTGTGKELYAQAIHNNSNRKNNPFISINCAALSEALIESELFGYEPGSFTGAKSQGKKGLFEIANGGTIFLDEIGDSSNALQVKLLRILQEKEIVRVGGYKKIHVDVKIIAATNKEIKELKSSSRFRADLFYRLSACILKIPPLCERFEDIEVLSNYFLKCIGCSNKIISEELKGFLMEYKWDGNIRELKNCIEYMGHFGNELLTCKDLPMIYREEYSKNYPNIRSNTNLYFQEIDEYENSVAISIIKILKKESMGRQKIIEELRKLNLEVSEYMLRKVIMILENKALLIKLRGRKGTCITKEGTDWILDFEKNKKLDVNENG